MNRKILLLLIIVFISSNLLTAQIIEPSGRRLRVIVDDLYADTSIIIGATTGSWAFGNNAGQVLDREFGYVTPENDYKQKNIHPDPTIWNWIQPDAWIQHIIDNNQILRIHGPIGPQCSNWVKDTNRTATELDTILREFMQALCVRYNNLQGFEYMDVVNETVLQGSWRTDTENVYKECPWYKIGQDTDINQTPLYIKTAFQVAQQYAPDIKFIFNQNSLNIADWDIIKETIIYLRNNGLRVDGIGWQAHVDNGWATPANLNILKNLIDWAQNNNLEFHVTEIGVYIDDTTVTTLQEQADTYRAILSVLLEKRLTGRVGWNTWYINDDEYTQWHPALFDSSFIAKPAYYAVQDELENENLSISNFNSIKYIVYPNPANGNINIEGNNINNIQIINQLGQIIKNINNKGESKFSINLNNIEKGIYIIKITTTSGEISVKKILLE